MLEKIGLPERPSLRGNNWVVDASHCQGCSSQFTFINRKHHCRRCGGLFCGTCTQQRMVLRGQGDSPVRICAPCKNLEEAARFELRHGVKRKAGRGGLKLTSRNEDEVLDQILGSERKELISSRSTASTSSSSILREHDAHEEGEESVLPLQTGTATPEELRQQAMEEKSKYKTLKAEGKQGEALKAFKRGKELERQAGTLELELRKNRRKASALVNTAEIQKSDDATSSSGRKDELNLRKSKDKDDISSELKELGWSDMDLHDAEKKPAPMSIEGELFSLLGEVSQKSENTSRGIDKSQVLALKKQALAFKREGRLGEAKEKLKEAKILEKQLEEQEFLGEDEESDDELAALIRGMDNDKHSDVAVNLGSGPGFNFDQLLSDDIGGDGNFEVTDEDLYDPEMDAALKSLGWDGDEDKEALPNKIQSLKREALNQKRAGNTLEAMDLLKKVKLLEKDLDSSSTPPEISFKQSEDEGISAKSAPKSRLMIQKELLAIKKKALALRREGKSNEADEELRKGNILEQQLEEIDNAPKLKEKAVRVSHKHEDNITLSNIGDEVEADVTDNDLNDPAYLGLLKNLGWDEEDDKNTPVMKIDPPCPQPETALPRRSKGEIQKELLGLKRKALTLRRQGQNEEAEETLNIAKVLEVQLEEMEAPKKEEKPEIQNHFVDEISSPLVKSKKIDHEKDVVVPRIESPKIDVHDTIHSTPINNKPNSLKQEILILKRNALALKREGKLVEAREELRKAKLLEKASEENSSDPGTSSSDASSSTPNAAPVLRNENSASPSSISKPLSSRDRFKLQQESLGLKRLSRKLRMEGRNEEADAEFEKAKAIEAQLEDLADRSSASGSKPVADVGVEDFLDPQLLSALKSLGIDDSEKVEPPKKSLAAVKAESSANEKAQLEEQIKAEKVKALTLKRSGKQAEALDALRRSKMLEKKLNSLT